MRVLGGAAKMSPVDSVIWRSSGSLSRGRLGLGLDLILGLGLVSSSSFDSLVRFCGGHSLRAELDGDGVGLECRLLDWCLVPSMLDID